jgi:hypothetical protein
MITLTGDATSVTITVTASVKARPFVHAEVPAVIAAARAELDRFEKGLGTVDAKAPIVA